MIEDDTLTTGVLLLGGGAAGYALGRWVLAPRLARAASAIPQTTDTPTAPPTGEGATAPATPTPTRPSPTPSRPSRPAETAPPSPVVADGPVSSPAQIDLSPDASEAEAPSDHRPSRRFDRIFDRYRESIPIEYLRALAIRESDMNPEERKGPAWGLLQIIEVVRRDYNQAHGTRHTREDLLDPAINVAIACWLLRLIIRNYAKHHPDVPNLRADWDNPRFVELLTLGWNGGFSEAGGVGRVVRYLKERHYTDITIDRVHKHARAAGASRHLQNAKKVAWCKSVVRLYERQRAPRRT